MIYRAKGTLCNQKNFQGLEALDPSLGLIFPSQGLTLARQCIILKAGAGAFQAEVSNIRSTLRKNCYSVALF